MLVREQWVILKPATLHCDSKQMPSLSNNNIIEECLAVLVGNAYEMKFPGVPLYPPGSDRKSGDIIADLTVDLLRTGTLQYFFKFSGQQATSEYKCAGCLIVKFSFIRTRTLLNCAK